MDCPEFATEKIDGSDSPGFRDHRGSCEGCRRDLEDLDDVRHLYHEAVAGERYSGKPASKHRWQPPAWLPLVAAAGILLSVVVAIVKKGGESAEVPEEGVAAAAVFHRMSLQPWAGDRALDRQFADAWRALEMLERRNP